MKELVYVILMVAVAFLFLGAELERVNQGYDAYADQKINSALHVYDDSYEIVSLCNLLASDEKLAGKLELWLIIN